MATLTETAYYTRKTIKWGIAALIVFFILKFALNILVDTWRNIHPPAPPPPTVAFGKLPVIKWPAKVTEGSPSAKLQFTLETIEGVPPTASATGTVFFIPKPTANLLSLSRANMLAQRLGFKGEPITESTTIYRWTEGKPFSTLRMDIVNSSFKITYDFAADNSVFSEKNLLLPTQAVNEIKTYLQSLGLLSPPLSEGTTRPSYWQLQGINLIPTTSLSEADALRIDLGRQDIMGLKLLSPSYPEELIYFIFSGSRDPNKHYLEISYKYWHIDLEQSATYPLITSAQAWEILKSGGGYLVSTPQNNQPVVIRKIYLAYYYADDYQNFLQPIFVFEGDQNFLGFVSAVSPDWVSQ